MPSPTTTLPVLRPRCSASERLSSKLSGSQYFHILPAADRIAATTDGAGPKQFSLAPMRALNGLLRVRSCASGPTNGTVEGSAPTSGVKLGREADMGNSQNVCCPIHQLQTIANGGPKSAIYGIFNRWLN